MVMRVLLGPLGREVRDCDGGEEEERLRAITVCEVGWPSLAFVV